jgi:hypothetical protein
LPLETLDQFGRGLVKQYRKEFGQELSLMHKTVKKTENGVVRFDNVLRIFRSDGNGKTKEQNATDGPFIDLYEYYWADLAQDKASWKDLNTWLQGVVKGAESFYDRNAVLGKQYKDQSIFFDSKTGNFKTWKYRIFLTVVSKLFYVADFLCRGLLWLVARIPFLGNTASSLLESYLDTMVHNVVNIISEVAIYNVVDPKSKFFETRTKILDGAVRSLRYLLEKERTDWEEEEKNKNLPVGEKKDAALGLYYSQVIVAGHSLGTQVAYDAINKVNLLVNKGEIKNYDYNGKCRFDGSDIVDQLNGFITFGSPLDKIVFFLRENVPDEEYVRQQIMDHYNGFKQRDLDGEFNNTHTNKQYVAIETRVVRMLDAVQWRNYFDDKDYVSGGLDYYYKLTNINCQFKAGRFGFTHSYYWDYEKFYRDIISNYLIK